MEDLSVHRLTRMSQIEELRLRIGVDKFEPFRTAVFETLEKLMPGEVMNVREKVRPANQGVFMTLCCEYMVLKGSECNIEIGNGWDSVLGVQSVHDHLLELEQIRRRRQLRDRVYEKAE